MIQMIAFLTLSEGTFCPWNKLTIYLYHAIMMKIVHTKSQSWLKNFIINVR